MSDFFDDILNTLSGEDFEERPVDIETFLHSPDHLNMSDITLSEHQLNLVKRMSQIYKLETLIYLYGEEKGHERFAETTREIIMQLGKGSGKDFTSCIAVAYVVYLLLCLRNPAPYYGKPRGNAIDIINVAINSDQAQRVFFNNFVEVIDNAPWFAGKFEEKAGVMEFDKNITVYSAHSEREAFEGYNTLMVILDEISGFALTSTSGNEKAKTAPAIYDMYKGSVTSRFAQFGKLVLLSFPRFEDDFIQQKYKDAVWGNPNENGIRPMLGEMETLMRHANLKIDPDLPDGTEGNEFEIQWEEDNIIRYAYPYTFALRRPSWEVNPTKDLQVDYALDFYKNPGDALGRFACMPSNLEDGFFKRMDKIKEAFSRLNGVDQQGVFHPSFMPEEGVKYFMHVDLAQKHDYCAVGMGHVSSWQQYEVGPETEEVLPVIRIDALRWWTPTKEETVDFKSVIEYIKSVRRRGFDIELVTFDRWNSHDTMLDLNRIGIETDILSVDKKHYDDFLVTAYDSRLLGPNEELLIKELGELRKVLKGQKVIIDHPRKGSKDLSDAVCGAIFNSITHTPREQWNSVEAVTLTDLRKRFAEEERRRQGVEDGIIRAPKAPRKDAEDLPEDIESILKLLKVL